MCVCADRSVFTSERSVTVARSGAHPAVDTDTKTAKITKITKITGGRIEFSSDKVEPIFRYIPVKRYVYYAPGAWRGWPARAPPSRAPSSTTDAPTHAPASSSPPDPPRPPPWGSWVGRPPRQPSPRRAPSARRARAPALPGRTPKSGSWRGGQEGVRRGSGGGQDAARRNRAPVLNSALAG
eukprot:811312-Prorocentrum_minimum.AAC.2